MEVYVSAEVVIISIFLKCRQVFFLSSWYVANQRPLECSCMFLSAVTLIDSLAEEVSHWMAESISHPDLQFVFNGCGPVAPGVGSRDKQQCCAETIAVVWTNHPVNKPSLWFVFSPCCGVSSIHLLDYWASAIISSKFDDVSHTRSCRRKHEHDCHLNDTASLSFSLAVPP